MIHSWKRYLLLAINLYPGKGHNFHTKHPNIVLDYVMNFSSKEDDVRLNVGERMTVSLPRC